jgi:hypothetical protein
MNNFLPTLPSRLKLRSISSCSHAVPSRVFAFRAASSFIPFFHLICAAAVSLNLGSAHLFDLADSFSARLLASEAAFEPCMSLMERRLYHASLLLTCIAPWETARVKGHSSRFIIMLAASKASYADEHVCARPFWMGDCKQVFGKTIQAESLKRTGANFQGMWKARKHSILGSV